MTHYKGDLVVSRYNEDVSWLDKVSGYNTFLYNKGGQLDGSIPLPNVGRELDTYLHHIITNYNDLSEWTFFTQGHPFDHVKDYLEVLKEFPQKVLSHVINMDDKVYFLSNGVFNRVLYSKSDGKPHHFEPLNIDDTWSKLFETPPLGEYPFAAGVIFISHRDVIRSRTIDFYKKVNDICLGKDVAPWEFERLFPSIFNITIK